MIALKYLLFPPKGDQPAPHPLIIFLHGSGERGDDLELVKKWGLPRYAASGEVELPAFVAVPQCPDGEVWSALTDSLDVLLDGLLSQHPIDPDRVYLTGFSLGGYGTWVWGSARPERFAALVPVGGSAWFDGLFERADLERLRSTPIWMVHGAADQAVSVSGADEVAAALTSIGANFGYTRYPDATHGGTSDRAFRDMELYRWLLAQRRGNGS